mmetsp:Transcript_29752/g.97359  ORF Transcript_29752/g.97359 Transcript_29752/m.97359 type:complete len:570 (-) Transcript_29752:140-1849(-)
MEGHGDEDMPGNAHLDSDGPADDDGKDEAGVFESAASEADEADDGEAEVTDKTALLGERGTVAGSATVHPPKVTLAYLWKEHRAFFIILNCVAFSQGLVWLSDLALQYLLKDDFGQSPAEAAYITGSVLQLPWVVKPLYGFFSDSFSLWGYRRRPYLVFFSALSSGAFFLMATVATTLTSAIITLFVASFSMAFVDVLSDALLVQRSRGMGQEGASYLLAWYFGVAAGTRCVSTLLGGILLEYVEKQTIFLITGIAPIFVCFAAILVKEVKVEDQRMSVLFRTLCDAFSAREKLADGSYSLPLWRPALFIFLWQAMPSSSQTMFYFFTNELGFSESFMGFVSLAGCTFSLLAVILYQTLLSNVSIRQVVLWGTVVMTVVGAALLLLVLRINVDWGISDEVFSIGDRAVMSGIATLAHYPLMLLAVRICPEHVEASLYAALMSANNLGAAMSIWLGGLITQLLDITEYDYDNLWVLVVICTATGLLPLVLIQILLPESDSQTYQGMGLPQDGEPPPADAAAAAAAAKGRAEPGAERSASGDEEAGRHPISEAEIARDLVTVEGGRMWQEE